MLNTLNEIFAYIGSSTALMVLLAALFEWFVPYPFIFRLNRLLPNLAKLGRRVNKFGHNRSQQILAGILLPLIILSVAIFLVIAAIYLSGNEKLVECILLLLILESRPPRKATSAIVRYVQSGQNNEAKELLSRFTLRRTDKLSAMGLMKATTEMTVLRLFYNFYMPIMICLTLGIYAAAIYRVFLLCRMAFNLKLPFNQVFGSFSTSITILYEVLPALALLTISSIIPHKYSIKETVVSALHSWPSKTGGLFLATVAAAQNIKLGGPRYYLLTMFRFPTLGNGTDPDATAVKKCSRYAVISCWSVAILVIALEIACRELIRM